MYAEGQKLRVIVPINVSEDCEWPIGLEVEIVQADKCDIGAYAWSKLARGLVSSFQFTLGGFNDGTCN